MLVGVQWETRTARMGVTSGEMLHLQVWDFRLWSQSEFKSYLSHLLTVWPWPVPSSVKWITVEPTTKGCWEGKLKYTPKRSTSQYHHIRCWDFGTGVLRDTKHRREHGWWYSVLHTASHQQVHSASFHLSWHEAQRWLLELCVEKDSLQIVICGGKLIVKANNSELRRIIQVFWLY